MRCTSPSALAPALGETDSNGLADVTAAGDHGNLAFMFIVDSFLKTPDSGCLELLGCSWVGLATALRAGCSVRKWIPFR